MEDKVQQHFDRDSSDPTASDRVTNDKRHDLAGALHPLEERRLIRKIDLNLMPLLIVSYGLQYVDKTSLSYSAILNIQHDLNLRGQDFSWASGIFYIGYLAASYPISLGFVRFPLGKYLSVLIFLWGIVLTLHTVADDFASLMVLRTLLGVFESAISPGFSMITGMWYTPPEHVSRHSFWFTGNIIASVIGSMIAYGILYYAGDFPQWKMLFLIFGLITIAWSVLLWFYLPDSPSTAHFLTPTERKLASLRPKKFQRTTQTKKWDRAQFKEALIDPKTWWLVLFAFVICVPNGGLTSFGTLIINGFGYDKFQTILMGLPAAAFQLTMVILAAILTTNIRRSRLLVLSAICLVAIAGILMIKLLPKSNKLARLAGLWLTTSVSPAFPLMMSLFASNTAGFTKKSSVVGLIFVGYCVGNFVGPQFFRSEEAPEYESAFVTILACAAIVVVITITFHVYLRWVNGKRDREQGVHIDPEEHREVNLQADEELDQVDETDMQNKSFRYVL
ncbi:permease of the major facilitator superfamily [Aspergillus candidus]|uniref:Permease of the major facilitator superfamily n=1 Tax=Aspergillus candidus TaxID=41067 RepID=A0A2I2EY99_ASPCN|nr:permease of the major facilitator superfamily [Aspergillus candidus]PLB33357.1 permease of the major facilitator superfamily [Aspergillus candidus]